MPKMDVATALQMFNELAIKHEQLQNAYLHLASTTSAQNNTMLSFANPLNTTNSYLHLPNNTGTCIQPNHPEAPENNVILTSMIVIVTGIIIVTISFEYLKDEWERRMHASLKAVVKNVFSELTILGFIGLIMFLTTKLGKERLDQLAYSWFNTSCFHTTQWCEDDEPLLVCPENVLIELTENVHIVLFLIMLIFLIEAVMVIRAGKHKMRQWHEHEEFCLSNSLGVAAARVKLSADHFENVSCWSCGLYNGIKGRWICGCYPKNQQRNTKRTSRSGTAPDVDIFSMQAPMNVNGAAVDTETFVEPVWDALSTARHFGKLPEKKRMFMCPCLHARDEYFESRSQLRYCTMRTGFINAHNQRMNLQGCKDLKLPTSFDFAEYVSHLLGEHLAEMVDVSPFNWMMLWGAFLIFMVFDFMDLWEEQDGWLLVVAAVGSAYLSCVILFIIRNDTIHIEHALLNDSFMSFHVSHGFFGRLMCSCCFSAEKIRVAHHQAIRFNLYEQDHSEADPIAELRREAHQEQKQEQKVAFEKVRRTSMMSAAVDAAKFAETLRNTRERNKTEMLKESLLSMNQREKGSSMASISENSDESSDTSAPLGSSKKVSFANKFKKISLKGAGRHFVRQYTAPSIEVDPIKLHRFDTHKLDYDHENHRPKYRWKYDEELSDWVEIPVGAAGGRAHCCKGKEDMTHHQQLFFFGKYHRHFLFNYVRMSLLLLAVYMGVFIIQFGQSILKHFNPESEEERTYKDLVTPIIFFVFAMIPVIVHDTLLPDIVAKIVQTTKTEQMIDTKHVQRVLGMMKAKNALMVLHNMSSFMHHIDEEAHTANLLAQEVLKGMEGMESLSEKETTALLGRCVPITYRKGERIVEAGTSANSMYIVLEGSVGFTLINTKHGKTDVVEAGSFFGSRSMITGSKTDYNAKALHKVLLFKLTHDDARTHLPDHVWEGLVARAEAEAKQIAERGCSLTSMRSMRKQSITSLIRSNSITPPPKKKQRHRHLKSALQMLRELAMHSTFDSIDEDGGGTVSTEELSRFFSKLFPINHPYHLFHVDQINILGKELDVSGNNEIDEKDFHDYMMPIIVREDTIGDPEESARRMFNILDEQGSEGANGKVTTKKFKDLLNLFGMSMSFEEVRELFHEYDEDFDGYLDEEEFTRMMIESGVEG